MPGRKSPDTVRKRAVKALVARRILEIYADGGGYKEVKAEFGTPRNPRTGERLNSDALLDWAHEAILGDAAKLLGAAIMVDETARLALANMADYMTVGADGRPVLDFSSLTREQAAALGEVTVDTRKAGEDVEIEKVKFKLHDKIAAIRLALQAYGALTERHEHSGPGGGAIPYKDMSEDEVDRRLAELERKFSGDA